MSRKRNERSCPELEAAWIRQLQKEFEEICRLRGVKLVMPVFEIRESRTQLGGYQPGFGILVISRELIGNYSWLTVLEVLKHEMAHQLCDEESPGAPPHGDAFQRACERLGVQPLFCKSRITLQDLDNLDSGETSLSTEGYRCLQRVEKLLALAGSSNIHEAEAAMQKANELLATHQLAELMRHRELRYVCRTILLGNRNIALYQRYVASILQKYFKVRVVLSLVYAPGIDEELRAIDLHGTAENVAIAEYCYHFLDNRLAFFWAENKHRYHGAARTHKNSYYLGILKGFGEKLEESSRVPAGQKVAPELKALLVAADRGLDAFVSERYDRLQRRSGRRSKIYQQSYADGQDVGRSITLQKPIEKGDGNLGRLVE